MSRIAAEDEDNPATDKTPIRPMQPWACRPGKTSIHASFDRDVVEFFKRGGQLLRNRMNAVLRRYMEAQQAKKSDR